MSKQLFIIANWKMHGLRKQGYGLAASIAEHVAAAVHSKNVNVIVCPPTTLLASLAGLVEDSPMALGGQDCHWQDSGAYTGDISAPMLVDAGCAYVILGHSERRHGLGEESKIVAQKATNAHHNNLVTVICVGETLDERSADITHEVIQEQLRDSLPETLTLNNTIIAYEPVWAIGTGNVPTQEDIMMVHQLIASYCVDELSLEKPLPILYGGSVNQDNAAAILSLEKVDGVLVGGASLKEEAFCTIIDSAVAVSKG